MNPSLQVEALDRGVTAGTTQPAPVAAPKKKMCPCAVAGLVIVGIVVLAILITAACSWWDSRRLRGGTGI